jgi:putative ABC transport system permease protein
MNLFQLVIKQMRQRALSTWLTLLSVTLGVGLAITILILYREAGNLFGQTDYGYDVILGKPGSGTQLVMNTVYHIDQSPGNIPYTVYEEMLRPDRLPIAAVPVVMGDNFKGDPVIGTTTAMFGINQYTLKPLEDAARLEYQPKHFYEFAEGHCFAGNRFEAVVGSDAAANDGLKIGSTFSTADSQSGSQSGPLGGKPQPWTVVGILKPTLTAADSGIYIPIQSYYTVPSHAAVLNAGAASPTTVVPSTQPSAVYAMNPDGTFELKIPEGLWQISAILANTPPPPNPRMSNRLIDIVNSRGKSMAVDPSKVMKAAMPNLPTDLGFNVVIGPTGDATQLVKSTVYHIGKPAGMIPYSEYEQYMPTSMLPPAPVPEGKKVEEVAPEPSMNFYGNAKIAVPMAVGDTYQGRWRIIATTTNMFGIDDETQKPLAPEDTLAYRPDKYYEFAEGHCFAPNRFEAIVGSDVAQKSDLKIGSVFQATHGETPPKDNPDIHPEKWKVVGVLKKTFTANDGCIFIPLKTDYTVEEHSIGLKAQWLLHQGLQADTTADPDDVHTYRINPDGTFDLFVPREQWEVSAVMVKARGFPQQLIYSMSNRSEAMAVNPAQVMRTFFDTFLKGPTLILLMIAFLVSIVAAVGILVSIYNSVSARMREIAIMRALGATRRKVLQLICVEAGLVGLFGGILGLVGGHLLGAVASGLFNQFIGQGINWVRIDVNEVYYLLSVVVVALLAGLVPALKAYSTPVATNLVVV